MSLLIRLGLFSTGLGTSLFVFFQICLWLNSIFDLFPELKDWLISTIMGVVINLVREPILECIHQALLSVSHSLGLSIAFTLVTAVLFIAITIFAVGIGHFIFEER